MKLLAAAVALILVGLSGVWLWFDATATARQDTPGVVVTLDDPAPAGNAPGAVHAPEADSAQDDGRQQATSSLAATLQAARGGLQELSSIAQQDQADAATNLDGAGASHGVSGFSGRAAPTTDGSSAGPGGSGGGARQPSPPAAPAAPTSAPHEPVPVAPPGQCWDDGEWGDCDDDDDDDDDLDD